MNLRRYLFAIIVLFLFVAANADSTNTTMSPLIDLSNHVAPSNGILTIGIGYPIGITNDLGNVGNQEASAWNGDNTQASGWDAFINYVYIHDAIDSVGSSFGMLYGYAFNSANVTVQNAVGISGQLVNLTTSCMLNELKLEPGWAYYGQKIVFFIGVGVVYTFVNINISGFDNVGNSSNTTYQLPSGFGLAGNAQLFIHVAPSVGFGIQGDITNKNSSVGICICFL